MEAYYIRTEEDFISTYFYDDIHAKKNLPKKYPCILIVKHIDGGLAGNYVKHDVINCPNNVANMKDYFNGIKAGLLIKEQ